MSISVNNAMNKKPSWLWQVRSDRKVSAQNTHKDDEKVYFYFVRILSDQTLLQELYLEANRPLYWNILIHIQTVHY